MSKRALLLATSCCSLSMQAVITLALPKKRSAFSKFENVEAAKRRPYLFLRSERHTVGAHGPDDVLQVVLANIDEVEGEAIASLRIDCFRDTQPARVGQSFQARRDVHAVAHEIVTVDDDTT